MKTTIVFLGLSLLMGTGIACGQKSQRQAQPADQPIHLALHGADGKPAQAPAVKEQADLPRKIIYNAAINLIVTDFTKAQEALKQLIAAQKGYVVTSDVSGTPGAPRSGHWQVRVRAAEADAFREAVIKLGELEKTTTDSQDVTEEYYDLDARIRNMKKEEERLLSHLEKSTGKLDDILKVEHELTRVRGEIERHQGRQNLISKLTAMTTVTITFRERSSYVPPEAASFGSTMARTFGTSWETLVDFGKGLLLVVVALVPWLIPLGLIGLPGWVIVRRRLRTQSEPFVAQVAEEAPPPKAS
jgi:hypothetical protein